MKIANPSSDRFLMNPLFETAGCKASVWRPGEKCSTGLISHCSDPVAQPLLASRALVLDKFWSLGQVLRCELGLPHSAVDFCLDFGKMPLQL
jgi:hypothetical protein